MVGTRSIVPAKTLSRIDCIGFLKWNNTWLSCCKIFGVSRILLRQEAKNNEDLNGLSQCNIQTATFDQ